VIGIFVILLSKATVPVTVSEQGGKDEREEEEGWIDRPAPQNSQQEFLPIAGPAGLFINQDNH
jgi:hypothetical protein